MDDKFDLQRFVDAQNPLIDSVRTQLRNGRKTTHWMWFIFPQISGLGSSAISRHFAIAGRAEAEAYLQHAILGPRLTECSGLLMLVEGRTANQIFGSPDDMKLRSSMTLFAAVAGGASVFDDVLKKYFRGEPDRATL